MGRRGIAEFRCAGRLWLRVVLHVKLFATAVLETVVDGAAGHMV